MTGFEALPWPAITAASGGWALFGWLAWMVLRKVMSGDLETRRVSEAKDKQIAAQEQTIREQGKQLSLLLGEAMPTVNTVLRALHERAEEMT